MKNCQKRQKDADIRPANEVDQTLFTHLVNAENEQLRGLVQKTEEPKRNLVAPTDGKVIRRNVAVGQILDLIEASEQVKLTG